MKNKTVSLSIVLAISIIIVSAIAYKIYLYIYVLRDAPEYPTEVMNDMVTYTIDPQTILNALEQGDSDVFMTALESPIYDNVPLLWTPGSFSWDQDDYQQVANALHQFVWSESLNDWHLYFAHFNTAQCDDAFRTDGASFGFYQRQQNSYYTVHNIVIDLNYGYVYAGNDDGYYTGTWKDIELEKVQVNSLDKALVIAEQTGGQDVRLAIADSKKCNIDIFFAPFTSNDADWGWRVTYWQDVSTSVYGIVIDPYTGGHRILK
jgi:hypothetical protein